MNVTGLAYDAGSDTKKWIYPKAMIAPPVSATQSIARAILVSVAPKSIGGSFRVKDDWNAPKQIKRDTVLREGATLVQIAGYSVILDRSVKLLETGAQSYLKKNSNQFIAAALQKFQKNQGLFLVLLSCASNFLAETVSRKLAPRDIWEKPLKEVVPHHPKSKDDDDDDEDDHKAPASAFLLPQTLQPTPLKPLTFANQPYPPSQPSSSYYRPSNVSSSSTPAIVRPAFSL